MPSSSSSAQQFALCLNNQDYPVSLQVGKLYTVISDADAEAYGYIRVIDDSGEDYGYAADRFFILELPPQVEQTLLAAA